MTKKIIIPVLLFSLFAGLFCQENDNAAVLKLTVEDAVKLALENNVSVKRLCKQIYRCQRNNDKSDQTGCLRYC